MLFLTDCIIVVIPVVILLQATIPKDKYNYQCCKPPVPAKPALLIKVNMASQKYCHFVLLIYK